MQIITVSFTCPCGGFEGLSRNPYRHFSHRPWKEEDHGKPPYCGKHGDPSYESCACCGFEFGSDDDPGTAPPVSFRQHRAMWIADGCHWLIEEKKQKDWSQSEQLANAGIQDPREAIQTITANDLHTD